MSSDAEIVDTGFYTRSEPSGWCSMKPGRQRSVFVFSHTNDVEADEENLINFSQRSSEYYY